MVDHQRRGLFAAAASTLLMAHLPALSFAQSRAAGVPRTADDALKLWYRVPARQWVDALPLGNGSFGAMVWGGTARERLQLNVDTLFAGRPYDANPDDARDALAEVRRLIFDGRYADAEALTQSKLMSDPIRQMPYQALGDLWLDLDDLGAIHQYRRELDLDTATATTRFRAGDVGYIREVFISPVDHCLALRLTADRAGALTGWLSAASEQDNTITVEDGVLVMRGTNGARFGIEGGLRFTQRSRVIARGGRIDAVGNRVRFADVDELLLIGAAATSYVRHDDVSGDPDRITAGRVASATAKGWDALHAAHLEAHQRLFRRVHLDLGTTEFAARSTDIRIDRFAGQDDPALAALYFQFGRYLLISSSQPGSQPANLQGIWNDLLDPPWSSKWTLNINTQMNYWPAEMTALPELVEPLQRMIEDLSVTGAETARRMYGAPGWVVHHNTDLWRQTSIIDGARFGTWPMGGAWLLMHLWDHWDYGRDLDYLRSVWPLFRGAAEFFVATLVEDPRTGELVTSPSSSPENRHPFGSSLCAGPAMDSQLLRDLFDCCIEATALLQTDPGFAEQLRATRDRLPPDRIGKAGQLQEWREDWDLDAPELHHRHVSHLYALHPSSQINMRDTPGLAAAARKSLEIRGDDATGWGIGWRLNLWARLRDGEHAYKILEMLLSPQRTYPNLFDAHPPFQIDGNFGGTAGITEMLMQSWGGTIFLLPALPKRWTRGEVRGLRARNTATVDIAWADGALSTVTLRSEKGGRYRLDYDTVESAWTLDPGQTLTLHWTDGALRRR